MKISTKEILNRGIYLCIVGMFLLAGPIQFFIGVSSTLYSVVVLGLMLCLVCFNILISKKVLVYPILILSLCLILLIFFSGLYNSTGIVKILLYLNFALVPLATTYLIKILEKNEARALIPFLAKLFRFIAIVQLPILLIQKYFYTTLIGFNRSNQSIAKVDFAFGTFPIKADHALGFFLLLYIMSFLFRKKGGEQIKIPWLLITYCSLSIFVLESNITKVVLILCFLFFLLQWLYKKISIFGFIAIIAFALIAFNFALKVPAIQSEYYHAKNKFTTKESKIAVDQGNAKRPQVLLYMFSSEPFKLIGNGPYDYYNILKGEFRKTTHFSQIIWTYNDLGAVGTLLVCLISFYLVRLLHLDLKSSLLLGIVLLFYLLMTNVLSEITMLLSLLMIKMQKTVSDGPEV